MPIIYIYVNGKASLPLALDRDILLFGVFLSLPSNASKLRLKDYLL